MTDQTERWMTVDEIAAYLQLSTAKIYLMAQSGKIPCVKVAGKWRFRRETIDDWMTGLGKEGNSVQPGKGKHYPNNDTE